MSTAIGHLSGIVSADDTPPAERRRTAAKLMSLLEDEPHRVIELIQAQPAPSDGRMVAGITGPSGVGKSTLTNALIAEYRKRDDKRAIGVIAVDPSSPLTGGAILGDRVRMMSHATDPGVFVRSLASRGHLGGLSLGTSGVSQVMQLMGCDPLLIETVGVGQNEVEVLQQADLVLVILSAGQGDSMQMLKAGLLEIGHVFVVNKADRPGADGLHGELQTMIERGRECGSGESPVLADPVSATEGTGIAELVDLMERLATERKVAWAERRAMRTLEAVRAALREAAARSVQAALENNTFLDRVVNKGEDIDDVARDLLKEAARVGE